MKTPRMANAVGYIDDDLISGAAKSGQRQKKISLLKWGSFAACFAMVILAGALIIPGLNGNDSPMDGSDSKYRDFTISGSESAVEWPWEYKTFCEKYITVKFDGREYRTRARAIGADLLGDVLGTGEAEGYDTCENKRYTETVEVREIDGVSKERLVAVGMDGEFYVYMCEEAAQLSTFGELMDVYGLAGYLQLDRFTGYEGFDETGHFALTDDAYIWEALSGCRDAERYADSESWKRNDRNYLSFTATSEALGMYKKVFYVTEDGYIWTNIFDTSHIYFIGEETAGKIITYAKSNSSETEAEPYEYSVAGVVTEIGDGYILIDDTVLCIDAADGTVFRVNTEDIRIRRCIECGGIGVGDTVVVWYQGEVSEDNAIEKAYSMYKGKLIDGDVAVPE